MGIANTRRFEVKTEWTEESIQQVLNDGTVNETDAFGLTPLAIASYEAKAARNNEQRRHWVGLANQLLEKGADLIVSTAEVFTEPEKERYVYDWHYKSQSTGDSVDLGDTYSLPFRYKDYHEGDIQTDFTRQSWQICNLLSLQDKHLSKRVLEQLNDEQYAELLNVTLYIRRDNVYTEEMARDARFETTLDKLDPNRVGAALTTFAEDNVSEVAQKMTRPGIPLDRFSDATVSPLHWACYHEDTELIDKLLRAGANPNLSADGVSPLVIALSNSPDPVFIQQLVKKGFRIAVDDGHSYSDEDKRDLAKYGFGSRARKGEPVRLPILGQTGLLGNQSFADTITEQFSHLILPAIIHEFEKSEAGKMALKEMEYFPTRDFLTEASFDASLNVMGAAKPLPHNLNAETLVEDEMIRLMQLHNTQNHPNIMYPAGEFERSFKFEWQPLTDKNYAPVQAPKGYSVECLTSSEELRAESESLGHCVGKAGYDLKCSLEKSDERPHIYSIRKDGKPISTVELKVRPHSKGNPVIQGQNGRIVGDKRISIVQHRGLNDKRPPFEARQALERWLDDLEKGKQTLNDNLGILPDNEAAYRQALAQYLTDKPYSETFYESAAREGLRILTMDDAERSFEDALRDVRRASNRTGRDGMLIYTDYEPDDKEGKQHMIGGMYAPEQAEIGQAVKYRDMSYQEWLRASGIIENVIRDIIREDYPEVADSLKEIWAEEDKQPIVGEMKDTRQQSEARPDWLARNLEERNKDNEASSKKASNNTYFNR